MSTARKEAEQMVRVLNRAEEALAALDELGGVEHEVEREAKRVYDLILKARDRSVEEWNETKLYKIARCTKAEADHYTAADGPCDVWDLVQDGTDDSKGDFWCRGCAISAAEKYEAYKESL